MKIETSQRITYPIKMSPGILYPGNKTLLEYGDSSRRLVIIDQGICKFYIREVENYFRSVDIEARIIIVDAIEDKKNLETLLGLLHEIETFGILRRNEPIITIGGGVLLDIVGMAASLYRRGIPYIRIPTTLVGLVDASVGIKVGINHEGRRNRLGGYYPPLVSYLDKFFLQTLPTLELQSGLGEILKIAIIKDVNLYHLIELYGPTLVEDKFSMNIADAIIEESVYGMMEELEPNLWETNLERLVDFGHSFSPIIEMRSLSTNSPLTHGQAVTLDVIFSSVLSYQRGLLGGVDLARIVNTARRIGLPITHPLFEDPLMLLESLNDTMRHRNGNQNLPFPIVIGKATFINNVTFEEIKIGVEVMKKVQSW